ncbi:MAG: hydrogenase maturation nickel metallochaperone HypA [Nitrososphaerales archaeon]
MHEYVYADRILQSVLEEVRAAGKSPRRVKVDAGEMLSLTRESLTMAYGILSKGTSAEGSKLVVRFTRGSVERPKCHFSGRLPVHRHDHTIDPAFACPQCGSSLKVVEGLDLKITDLKITGIEWGRRAKARRLPPMTCPLSSGTASSANPGLPTSSELATPSSRTMPSDSR